MDYIQAHLPLLVPTILPVAFLLANTAIKWMLSEEAKFYFFGTDMALCGCAVFTGSFLRQLMLHRLSDVQTALDILGLLGAVGIWFLCAWMGSKQLWWVSWIAAIIGMVLFSLCGRVSWNMLNL